MLRETYLLANSPQGVGKRTESFIIDLFYIEFFQLVR